MRGGFAESMDGGGYGYFHIYIAYIYVELVEHFCKLIHIGEKEMRACTMAGLIGIPRKASRHQKVACCYPQRLKNRDSRRMCQSF